MPTENGNETARGEELCPGFYDVNWEPRNLDVCYGRRAVFRALTSVLPAFSGCVLDIGCGSMPYRHHVLSPPSRAKSYVGLDLWASRYSPPDIAWDGRKMPLRDSSVDTAMATEVLEHCPDPATVLAEARRVLRPGGLFFFTVPFVWPLHDSPHDEYRYTPFALQRLLRDAGFADIELAALGGWDATLATVLGLWVRRRPMGRRRRAALSRLVLPIVRGLAERDRAPRTFADGTMVSAIAGTARKPVAWREQS